MSTAYFVTALVTIVANTFSGGSAIVAAMFRPKLMMDVLRPALATAEISMSWLIFPIGTLKTAGAVGLALGLLGVPLVGTAAAIGLILFFVCAAYTHIRVSDYSSTFFLGSCFFLPSAVATLALDLAIHY
ncbi:DoxX family protein [Nonomuraea turcica]|uniref:DoxX family protein n=1 Tax=Nonomuraea sp. G32 TaxID=3067274 RepID=UPI00273B0917|nr:DoxX family protein [Nonomuraea sp. G32]MDP4511794.1 DoxX family protein [Nonomuraea sp. G32]